MGERGDEIRKQAKIDQDKKDGKILPLLSNGITSLKPTEEIVMIVITKLRENCISQ